MLYTDSQNLYIDPRTFGIAKPQKSKKPVRKLT